MRNTLKRHLNYANLMASIAVFLALGGGAYAMTIPTGSVGAKQLKKNAVAAAKIKTGAVSGAKVKDDSLTGADVVESSLGTVPAANSANSAKTAESANTANSAKTAESANTANSANSASTAGSAAIANSVANGSVGGNGLKEITTVSSAGVSIAPGASASQTATCPAGTMAIGGGSFWSVTQGDLNIDGDLLQTTHSFRSSSSSWIARGGNASPTPRTFKAEAYCLAG